MLDIIISGGWLMVPIILCSIVALAIIFERLWFLRARRLLDEAWVAPIWQQIVQTGEHGLSPEALNKLKSRGFTGNFIHALLHSKNRKGMEQLLDYESQQMESLLKHHLHMLSTIATLSPLLGLLGTILGIIQVFQKMVAQSDIDPSYLSSGISVALITTAAGLIVAIPATFFHRYFSHKAEIIFSLFQRQSNLFIDALSGEKTI